MTLDEYTKSFGMTFDEYIEKFEQLSPRQFNISIPYVQHGVGCLNAWARAWAGAHLWEILQPRLAPDDYSRLISPPGYLHHSKRYTHARAVAVLKHYRDTGKVDWDRFDHKGEE